MERKTNAKSAKMRVVSETHHWIVGNGRQHWIGKDVNSKTDDLFIADATSAYKCGSPEEARKLVECEEAKSLIRSLARPGKFGVYLRNDKVEVSPCRS